MTTYNISSSGSTQLHVVGDEYDSSILHKRASQTFIELQSR